jgi:hypothetical protein
MGGKVHKFNLCAEEGTGEGGRGKGRNEIGESGESAAGVRLSAFRI